MIPIKLSLSGFLSYRDPVELDFRGFDLACISGANGAGKSSLLDGITWALFGQARKRDDSLINTQSETAEVIYTFGYESNVYRVQRVKPRDKTAILEFHIQSGDDGWKPLTERTLRDTEARIRETLRLDYETFVNASFFLQGKADQFTQQRPGDRKRILSSILGLEVWESYRKSASERGRRIEGEIGGLDGRLEEIAAELGEEDERRKRLKELEANLKTLSKARAVQEASVEEMRQRAATMAEQDKLVATLGEQLKRMNDGLVELELRLKERTDENKTFEEVLGREKQIESASKDWQDTRDKLGEWDETAARFHQHESSRHAPLTEIETAKARLESEIDNLHKEEERIQQSQDEDASLRSQLGTVQTEIEQVEIKLAQRVELERALTEAIHRQTEAKTENPILKEKMEKVKARISQLEDSDEPDCPLCGQALTEEHRREVTTELNEEGTKMGDHYRKNQALLKKANEHVSNLQDDIGGLSSLDEELRRHRRSLDQLSDQIERMVEQQKAWKQDGARRLIEIEKELKHENYAPAARKALAKVDAELKKIGYDAAAHDAIRKDEKEKRVVEAEMRLLENARATAAPLSREIEDVQGQIKSRREEIIQQQQMHDNAAVNLAASQAEAPDVAAAESEMLTLQEEENKVRRDEGAAQQMVAVLADLEDRKIELEKQRENLAQQAAQFKLLERAFGKDGVPAMLIEQALPQIEIKANEILERLSGGDMSIRFVTQQAYKDKKREDMKETLEIQISDSAGQRDYEMYSGGEAFRINFAIRLALSEVLAQRAGARLQTLVIDEGFGSQDMVGRQRLVEAINSVRKNFEKILVITHIDALKDAFPNRIEVEKTARGSVIHLV